MNKINGTFLLTLITAMILAGCQKVIDIDLRDGDRRYVIEGSVVYGTDSAYVIVSRTTSYFNSSPPDRISNASVELIMPDGSTVMLQHFQNGKYLAYGLQFSDASLYKLRVSVDDEVFTAESYMPKQVLLDSLESEFQPGFFGGEGSYNVFLSFKDSIGPNFYKVNTSINGRLLSDADEIQVFDDKLSDNTMIRIPVFVASFELGDTVDVELQSIDQRLYKFFSTFSEVAGSTSGSPFAAAPANPESNIKGGALGYFGAFTSSKSTIIIEE